MVKQILFDHIHVPAKNIFPIKGIGDPEERAQEYENTLKLFFHNKKPVFDLILLGVGEDGHTASLFPRSELLQEKKRWVRPVWVEEKKSWRISFTLPLINHAASVLFLVSGAEKKEIIKKLLRKKKNYSLPAELVNPSHGIAYWMLDEAAAHKKPFIITYSSYIGHPPRTKHG
jgi:6-phosphogluconolactonase